MLYASELTEFTSADLLDLQADFLEEEDLLLEEYDLLDEEFAPTEKQTEYISACDKLLF